MEKQILSRGYITNALTDGTKKIFGMIKDHHINFNADAIKQNTFYWSEVYCEPNNMAVIIRKGTLLVNRTADEMNNYFEQSKINLS
jgi:hypothetical protein